ncbi:CPDc [Geosmithia morbida]|uniref:Mitochondrial import inner membrane translocase subunit TIM50 n=1 Tax=Geosmithia morbida TaxID=1094350 RepID=A0A9P4YQJ8_9HYPO|nr:CPDc [Geosmithia morbida]KAF4120205.1 CPDc [Geosmithia morbida]
MSRGEAQQMERDIPARLKKPHKKKERKKAEAAESAAVAAAAVAASASAAKSREARYVPSPSSGGVPDPTPGYIARALSPPSRLASPRPILVVMDLNGTLLHRPSRHRPFDFVERPHARRFLQYCVDTFHLAIWSSARPENVDKMVSQLLTPEQRGRCVVVWGRDRFGLSGDDYNSRVQCYKRLGRLWDDRDVRRSYPGDPDAGRRWDQTNTVLVDDSTEKGRSEPFNILALPEFSATSDESTQVLPQVHDYLNDLCWQSDISRHIRQNPFRLNPNYSLPAS